MSTKAMARSEAGRRSESENGNPDVSGASMLLARIAADPNRVEALHQILGLYSHQARNKLHGMKLSLYLAGRDSSPECHALWTAVERRYQVVEGFFDRLQQLWRGSPLTLVCLPIRLLVEERRGAWSESLLVTGRGLVIEAPATDVRCPFDPSRLGQALDDLVRWRTRVGDEETDLRLAWGVVDGRIQLRWDEPRRQPARSIHPKSPPSSVNPLEHEASDLFAAPLLCRTIALHGGRLDACDAVPWRLAVSWPLVVATPE